MGPFCKQRNVLDPILWPEWIFCQPLLVTNTLTLAQEKNTFFYALLCSLIFPIFSELIFEHFGEVVYRRVRSSRLWMLFIVCRFVSAR